ncbi:lysophosphatidylcholine acyltransferase 1 [Caerostris darwini]|uniref:Lysophosphatidylcholine acyltransferase 1 n=1 Tax=Caerostris darwini TaxID=1538125 RepID=A0AAV4S208_9ARAC|nr:lysophosphatidylcholine acyltransferase 1 [Caerostris darwini]
MIFSGGFSPGVPVQPVFIRYQNELDTITWSWEGPGALKQLWLTLTQFAINCELEFLPVYNPSEFERENPRIFADNVQKFVSSWTSTPISDFQLGGRSFLESSQAKASPSYCSTSQTHEIEKSHRTTAHRLVRGARPDFFRVLSQHKRSSLDVRVYDAGLHLLRTDLKVKEKLKEAFKVFNSDNPTEHLETILYYWKGIQYSKLAYKSDTEELSSN